MFFIIMLSFQLAGGLILLLNGLRCSKDDVIRNCFPGSNVAKRDKNNNCVISKETMQKSALPIYLNIMAFANLVIGYGIAAFSPISTYSTAITITLVALCTLVFSVCEWLLIKAVIMRRYVKDEVVPYSILEEYGVDTIMTTEEIDEMLKKQA